MKMEKTVTLVEEVAGKIFASEIKRVFKLPADARLYITVPGGGDYSNMDLEIDEILVTYTKTRRPKK